MPNITKHFPEQCSSFLFANEEVKRLPINVYGHGVKALGKDGADFLLNGQAYLKIKYKLHVGGS